VPDKDDQVFTLAIHDSSDTWWYGDFHDMVQAPFVRYLVQAQTDESGDPVGNRLRPTVVNLGSAAADNVRLILHKTSGVPHRGRQRGHPYRHRRR